MASLKVMMARCNIGETEKNYEWEMRLQISIKDKFVLNCWLTLKWVKTFHQLTNGNL